MIKRPTRDADISLALVQSVVDKVNALDNLTVGPGLTRLPTAGGVGIGLAQKPGGETRAPSTRGKKWLWFCPEYAGAVLHDSSESHTGEMYGYLDTVEGHNCYVWETEEASAQEFSVSLEFPVPGGFRSWSDCQFYGKVDSGGEIELTNVYDTEGDAQLLTPQLITATSWTEKAFTMPDGTYTKNELMRMLFRLEAPAGGKIYLGSVGLTYR